MVPVKIQHQTVLNNWIADWETFKAVDNNIMVMPNEVQKQTFPMVVAERTMKLALLCISKDYKRNSGFL